MAIKITLQSVENELQNLIKTSAMGKDHARYMMYQALDENTDEFEFESEEQKALIIDYLSPTRVLH